MTPVVLWCGWPFLVRGARFVATWNLTCLRQSRWGSARLTFQCRSHPNTRRLSRQFPSRRRFRQFISAATTILLVLGQMLELRAREQTGSALRAPVTRRQRRQRGSSLTAPKSRSRWRSGLPAHPAGEKVPADGWVVAERRQSTTDDHRRTMPTKKVRAIQ